MDVVVKKVCTKHLIDKISLIVIFIFVFIFIDETPFFDRKLVIQFV